MSTTTPGTAPFCTRVLAFSYLKFECTILYQLIANLFAMIRVGVYGEKKLIFVLNLDPQAHNHNEGHGFEFFCIFS